MQRHPEKVRFCATSSQERHGQAADFVCHSRRTAGKGADLGSCCALRVLRFFNDYSALQVLSELISLQNKSHRVQANSEAEWNQLSHVIQQDRQARVKLSRYYLKIFAIPCPPPHRLYLSSTAQEALKGPSCCKVCSLAGNCAPAGDRGARTAHPGPGESGDWRPAPCNGIRLGPCSQQSSPERKRNAHGTADRRFRCCPGGHRCANPQER